MVSFTSREWLLGPVRPDHGWLALLACCLVNGIVDGAVFNNYGVFAAMQTGNTVIMCINTARLPEGQTYAYAKTLVVLVTFFVGAVITSHCWDLLPGGALRRVHISGNFAIQAALIFLGAALVESGVVPVDNTGGRSLEHNPRVIAVLPPLAFQAGATIATARILGFAGEIPVNVLTSTYAALAADKRLLKWPNPARDKRVLAVLFTIIGALMSAWIMKTTTQGIKACLWFAAGIKTIIALGIFFLFPPKAPPQKSVSDAEKGNDVGGSDNNSKGALLLDEKRAAA